MLRNFKYKFRTWKKNLAPNNTKPPTGDKPGGQALYKNLSVNLDLVRQKLGNSIDLIIREFNLGNTRAALVCLDGLVDKEIADTHILQPMLIHARMAEPTPVKGKNELWKFIKDNNLSAIDYKEVYTLDEVLNKIISGFTALLIDGLAAALVINTVGFEARDVKEPETEAVVRGPREGFTERLQVNTALLRRKIKSPDLRLERMTLGRVTKTDICIAYVQGIANDKIVDELKKRLQRIEIDAVLESGYIEAFIEDAPFSMFATVGNTEKPDIAAAKMLEGRVAVLVDGSPMTLTIPYLFIETIQVSEDYYSRWLSGTMMRWFRILSITLTTQLPALYVATVSFNAEVLPTILLITIAASREGVPLPAAVEMLFLGIIFEILREAGIRQPRPVGQAVSIIGALVIGEAAINAGLVSAPAVMVTVLTGIASFTIPAQSITYIFIRLLLLALAATTGFFGLILGIIIVLIHMVSLRSFGVPYLSPLAPANFGDWKDFLFRAPLWTMFSRPSVIGWQNRKRTGAFGMPRPPKDEEKKPAGEGERG
jgi:spore germination protein KA